MLVKDLIKVLLDQPMDAKIEINAYTPHSDAPDETFPCVGVETFINEVTGVRTILWAQRQGKE